MSGTSRKWQIDMSQFQRECTPSYFTNEGQVESAVGSVPTYTVPAGVPSRSCWRSGGTRAISRVSSSKNHDVNDSGCSLTEAEQQGHINMADSAAPKVKIGFHLGPQHGEYRIMRNQWMVAEELGIDALYSSDHFFAQDVEIKITTGERPLPTAGANFEGMTVQAAMAATTTRPEIGCLVHAIGYRNPHLLADMARTIDHISGGRFILGLGTGYLKQDFVEYGYQWTSQTERSLELAAKVPVIKDRLARLESAAAAQIADTDRGDGRENRPAHHGAAR